MNSVLHSPREAGRTREEKRKERENKANKFGSPSVDKRRIGRSLLEGGAYRGLRRKEEKKSQKGKEEDELMGP
jgi:hypothetical protein